MPSFGLSAIRLVLAMLVHAAVLRWVFPGAYDPFWPFNGDYYLPAALQQAGVGASAFLTTARPLGGLALWALGMVDQRTQVALQLLLVMVNAVLTAAIMDRLNGPAAIRPALLVWLFYCFVLFAHPQQYTFATFDFYAQLAFLFGAWAVLGTLAGWRLPAVAGCLLAGFLVKETYAVTLTLIFLALAWTLPADRKLRAARATLVPLCFLLALLHSRLTASPFVGAENLPGSPYRISLAPGSLLTELLQYWREGLPWMLALTLAVLLALTAWRGRKPFELALLSVAAGLSAMLPNATLPAHHAAGYSFEMVPILAAPLLMLPALLPAAPRQRWAICAVLLTLIAWQPWSYQGEYRAQRWAVDQQMVQRRLLQALRGLSQDLPVSPSRVLVTGIDFPFSPFEHGQAMRSLDQDKPARFAVVRYGTQPERIQAFPFAELQQGPVRWLQAAEAEPGSYDRVWMFRSDGSLVGAFAPGRPEQWPTPWGHYAATALVRYPALIDLRPAGTEDRSPAQDADAEGYRALQRGGSLLGYAEPALALAELRDAERALPDNPYVHYSQGLALERLGQRAAAAAKFSAAVQRDHGTPPNPAFAAALARVSVGPR